MTHNHHRDGIASLYEDTLGCFDRRDLEPYPVLRHLGSPAAVLEARRDDTELNEDKKAKASTREEAAVA